MLNMHTTHTNLHTVPKAHVLDFTDICEFYKNIAIHCLMLKRVFSVFPVCTELLLLVRHGTNISVIGLSRLPFDTPVHFGQTCCNPVNALAFGPITLGPFSHSIHTLFNHKTIITHSLSIFTFKLVRSEFLESSLVCNNNTNSLNMGLIWAPEISHKQKCLLDFTALKQNQQRTDLTKNELALQTSHFNIFPSSAGSSLLY